MKAAFIEMDVWMGHMQYIFTGEDASEILIKFNQVQDLSCLVNMGFCQEGPAGQAGLDKIEELIDKHYDGELTMQDFKDFDVRLSIGSMYCTAIAETYEEIEELKK